MRVENAATDAGDLLDDLNPVQRETVVHPGGPLLILAGAGSGKTRVLTRRIAWLIRRQGIAPGEVLAVTFTNKAAGEMRGRVETLLGGGVGGLWIGTFHGICLRWLKRHAREAGYQPNLSVFDQEDAHALLRRLLQGEGLADQRRRVREIHGWIGRAKNQGLDPEQLTAQARTPAGVLTARIYTAYQAELRRQNAVDFDDLLLGAQRLFARHPEIAAHYAARFRHVLVDEYQDTNHVQFLLVARLAEGHGNIFVVGDDDQSIYGWRGADIRNILEFQSRFPQARVQYLEQNYRSTRPILEFANAVVRRNRHRWEKTLWTARAGGGPPELFLAGDEDDEAAEIARRVTRALGEGRRPREIAIFYRMHAQSRALEDVLLRRRIPYVLVGGVYFYQRREVKDLLSYLRLLVNPRDEASLRRALAVPRRGIGERSVDALLLAARDGDRDPLDPEAAAAAGLRGAGRARLAEFAELIAALRARVAEPPEVLLHEIVTRVAYLRYLQDRGEDWEERAANVAELLEGARLFSSTEGGGVPEYLDQVSLLSSVDALPENADAVTLMTAHNAKGLEFPLVFVSGLEEGIFPHGSALDDEEEMEEERRLFYVACTRAMDALFLSASRLRRRFSGAASGLSRFLAEVPAELYVVADDGAAAEQDFAGGSRLGGRRGHAGSGRGFVATEEEASSVAAPPDEHPLVGRRVHHATFGSGIVTAVEGAGERARIRVRFSSGQSRKVIRGYLEWED